MGIAPTRVDGFLSVTDEMWQLTWTLNVMSAVRACRASPPLARHHSGKGPRGTRVRLTSR